MNNKNNFLHLRRRLSGLLLLFTLISSAFAEDIEIFGNAPSNNPNILLLLDHSGSMSWLSSGTQQTRIEGLREAFNTFISDPEVANVNVGLLEFSSGNSVPLAHGVSFPISPIDGEAEPIMLSNLIPYTRPNATSAGYFSVADDTIPDPIAGETVRDFLPRVLSSWSAGGGTPLVDSYHEAALYFRGAKPKWGLATPEQKHAAHPSTYTGTAGGTMSSTLTGNTIVCNTPDCGQNCVEVTEPDFCSFGTTSCGLGTNCATSTQYLDEECHLSSEAACLASNTNYTSCTIDSNCTGLCTRDVNTGACITPPTITPAPPSSSGTEVEIKNLGMCITYGTSPTLEICNGADNQLWNKEPGNGFGWHHYRSKSNPTQCFGSYNGIGYNLVTVPCEEVGEQAFELDSNTNAMIAWAGGCLEADSSTSGSFIKTRSCNGGGLQAVYETAPGSSPAAPITATTHPPLESFRIKTSTSNCLEVNGGVLTNQACDGSARQAFYTQQAKPGFVWIRAYNGYCLEVPNGSLATNTRITANTCKGETDGDQVFEFSGNSIIADHSSMCFDFSSVISSGDTIEQQTCQGGSSYQSFTQETDTVSCPSNGSYLCKSSRTTTSCDHRKYSCDELASSSVLDSTDIQYKSPISNKCESNVIVMLSDGRPTVYSQSELDQTMAEIKTLTGMSADCNDIDSHGRCGEELARFLATQDQNPDIEGDNFVNTYTIGFDIDPGSAVEAYLSGIAAAGNGEYFPATNAAALATVFKSIVTDVAKTARSFSAPVYTVDPSSHLAHSRNLYIPVFEDSAKPVWSGNLKKYKLNDLGQITGKNGKVAINSVGALDPEVADYWAIADTGNADDNPITAGGVASLLTPASRNLLTDDGSSLVNLDANSVTRQALTPPGEGVISATLSEALIKFIQGYQSDGQPRLHMGDILHSKPIVVSYGTDKEVIFFGTNEGYLHAIDTRDRGTGDGGKELFAYMPQQLLSNIKGQYTNEPLTGDVKRIYGVDGEMNVWIDDLNKNGKVDNGESAYLYFGLRRGGNAYYALDITDPSSPKLLWTIDGTTGSFSKLGQTWSKPNLAKLRYKDAGTTKFEQVLVFGGGYDASVYDEESHSARDYNNVRGNGVYIVNAKTGDHIWSYEGGELKHSIPSGIRTIDVDRDGSIDRLYFGDTGGNVWRVDLNVDDSDADASMHDVKKDAAIYRFANLAGSTDRTRRMFFYEPEVSLFKHKGRVISVVSIGSGYRSHPNNTETRDRLYVLYDENTLDIPKPKPRPIRERHLVSADTLNGSDFLPDNKGWYKVLRPRGEKVLSSPIIFSNKVIFTTFSPFPPSGAAPAADECLPSSSNFSKAYVLDLMKGAATVDLDGDGVLTDADQSAVIGTGEIADTPNLVFNKPSNCSNDGCDHNVDIRVGKMEKPLPGGSVNLGDYLPKIFWLDTEN